MNNLAALLVNTHARLPRSTSDSCEPSSEESDSDSYNLPLRIGSIFVLLVAALLGASIPILSATFQRCRIPDVVINTGKFFGIGVIIATAFIHILPEAVSALTDPCLPGSWSDYEAYAGLFTMLAILAMQLIEFIAHYQLHKRPIQEKTEANGGTNLQSVVVPVEVVCDQPGHSHGISLLDDGRSRSIITYLLELGVVIHSVLIGITLGTEEASTFTALFIALCFHQFFEAVALGAQLAKLKGGSKLKAVLLMIFFAITTPIGIAIGIAIHLNTYNPKSESALISSGVLNSVSSGILIYVSLVDMIAVEMGAGAKSFFELKTGLKVLYFIALYLGAALMAVLGRWA